MQVSKFHSTFRYPNECVHIPTFWRQDFEFPVTTLVDFATWLAITIEDGIVEASRSNPDKSKVLIQFLCLTINMTPSYPISVGVCTRVATYTCLSLSQYLCEPWNGRPPCTVIVYDEDVHPIASMHHPGRVPIETAFSAVSWMGWGRNFGAVGSLL